jgi:hypothetical protein
MAEFDKKTEHRLGLQHGNAEELSQIKCAQCGLQTESTAMLPGNNNNIAATSSKSMQSGLNTPCVPIVIERSTSIDARSAASISCIPNLARFASSEYSIVRFNKAYDIRSNHHIADVLHVGAMETSSHHRISRVFHRSYR